MSVHSASDDLPGETASQHSHPRKCAKRSWFYAIRYLPANGQYMQSLLQNVCNKTYLTKGRYQRVKAPSLNFDIFGHNTSKRSGLLRESTSRNLWISNILQGESARRTFHSDREALTSVSCSYCPPPHHECASTTLVSNRRQFFVEQFKKLHKVILVSNNEDKFNET